MLLKCISLVGTLRKVLSKGTSSLIYSCLTSTPNSKLVGCVSHICGWSQVDVKGPSVDNLTGSSRGRGSGSGRDSCKISPTSSLAILPTKLMQQQSSTLVLTWVRETQDRQCRDSVSFCRCGRNVVGPCHARCWDRRDTVLPVCCS